MATSKTMRLTYPCPRCGELFRFDANVEYERCGPRVAINTGMVRRIVEMHYENRHPAYLGDLSDNDE